MIPDLILDRNLRLKANTEAAPSTGNGPGTSSTVRLLILKSQPGSTLIKFPVVAMLNGVPASARIGLGSDTKPVDENDIGSDVPKAIVPELRSALVNWPISNPVIKTELLKVRLSPVRLVVVSTGAARYPHLLVTELFWANTHKPDATELIPPVDGNGPPTGSVAVTVKPSAEANAEFAVVPGV